MIYKLGQIIGLVIALAFSGLICRILFEIFMYGWKLWELL